MKRMSVAVIGCGWAGVRHARAFADLGAKVAWAVDLDATRAGTVAKLQVGTRVSADYREALADPDLTAVDICLPHDLHAPIAIEAARHGKHILCEKPIAATLAVVYVSRKGISFVLGMLKSRG